MRVEPPVATALGVAVAVLALQRLSELVVARDHEPMLRARGGVELGRETFAGFVVLHALLPVALVAEVLGLGARPGDAWPWWLAALALASLLRALSMRALGERWHPRVLVVPGEPRVRTGIYRWIAHPNYVAVVIECAALPLLFGAWRTAIAASLANLALLAGRVRLEERALAWAEGSAPQPAATASGSPVVAAGTGEGSRTRSTSSVMSS